MLVNMEKSWLGKMLSRSPKSHQVMVPPNVDYTDADVQFSLGLQFASGVGAAQDYVQAADWYRKAAEQNHPLAQFNLGTMYANGQGVAKDDAQSMIWFGRAANIKWVEAASAPAWTVCRRMRRKRGSKPTSGINSPPRRATRIQKELMSP